MQISTSAYFREAMSYSQGVYRPSLDSKMNTLSVPFNAVVREKSILDIYALVDPLDGWLNNATTVEGGELWVDVVDPAVISVDWFVNRRKSRSEPRRAVRPRRLRNLGGHLHGSSARVRRYP